MSPGLTWIVNGLLPQDACRVLPVQTTSDATAGTAPPLLKNWSREQVGSLEDWTSATPMSLEVEKKLIDQSELVTRESGLVLRLCDGGVAQIYVPLHVVTEPNRFRNALIWLVHKNMMHMSHSKVSSELLRTYWWPHLRRDVKSVLATCAECNLAKGKRQLAHGNYRAIKGGAPRERYAILSCACGCSVRQVSSRASPPMDAALGSRRRATGLRKL